MPTRIPTQQLLQVSSEVKSCNWVLMKLEYFLKNQPVFQCLQTKG